MINLVQKQEIIIKHREGVSNRQIAREMGIDKNTVNTYVNQYDTELRELLSLNPDINENELPPGIMEKPRYNTENRDISEESKSALPIIEECLAENARKRETGRSKQQMRKTDIYRHLKKKGFTLSYSTVKRLIRETEQRSREAFIRQELVPGISTEFDWGVIKLNIGDTGYKKYQMAVFSSSYGNYRFARLYRTQDTAAFQESHVDYFSFCGGVYRTVIYDNMRVAVAEFVGHSDKKPTEALLELSAYYGFSYRFCNVRRGNEKSHAERCVDVVRHKAFVEPGNDCFDSLAAANEHLLRMCMELNNEPLSDGRIPAETFEEERPLLMSKRPKMPCFIKKTGVKVDKYSTVVVNKVHYSVPDTLVGKKLDVRIYTNRVEMYGKDGPVARHERHYTNGEYVIDIFHYLRTMKRKPGALPQSSALSQSDALVKKMYEDYYTSDPKTFLDVLGLISDIGAENVQTALTELSKTVCHDYTSDKIRLVHDRLVEEKSVKPKTGTDRLSAKSKSTLSDYDRLRDLQTRSAG